MVVVLACRDSDPSKRHVHLASFKIERRSLYESSTPSNEHKRDVGACSSVALRPPPISRSRYYDLPVRNYYGQVYNVSFLSFSVKLLIRVQISNNTHNGKRMIRKKKEKRRKNCKIHYR